MKYKIVLWSLNLVHGCIYQYCTAPGHVSLLWQGAPAGGGVAQGPKNSGRAPGYSQCPAVPPAHSGENPLLGPVWPAALETDLLSEDPRRESQRVRVPTCRRMAAAGVRGSLSANVWFWGQTDRELRSRVSFTGDRGSQCY